VRGPKGEAGATIIGWKIDYENYRAVPFLSDGMPGPELDLRPLFEAFFAASGAALIAELKQELEKMIGPPMIGQPWHS
jgi:hypothetical protein